MKALSTLSLVAFASLVHAVSFSDIQFWVGSGSNEAAVVIDFNDGQAPKSYVWGFRWNGSATGETALRAIVNADANLDAVIDSFSFGASLNTASYLPLTGGGYRHSRAQDFGAGEVYWSYWTSANESSSWGFASTGMTDRVLVNGAVDGWAFSNPGYNAIPPAAPVAAVPEPASILALSAGVASLLRRRRQSHSGAPATYK